VGVSDELRLDRVLVNVLPCAEKFVTGSHAAVVEAALPDWDLGFEAMREATFNQLHHALERDVCWRDEEVNVVRHYDERVEEITAFSTVVLKRVEEEIGVTFDSEEGSALGDD
jgi:hypothetical protein